MAGDRTLPSETVTRKPDDVGKPGTPAAGGGRQTSDQAAITDLAPEGRSDDDRNERWREAGGRPGRDPSPIGGASSGHADQKSASQAGGMPARGHYKVEKGRS